MFDPIEALTQKLGRKPKVAIVHDWIDVDGGSERMVEAIVELFKPYKFCTLLANPKSKLTKKLNPILETSWIQKLPFAFKLHRFLLALYPRAIESFDVSDADIVISSSHCVAKGVLTRADQLHICYTYTPARYLWDQYHDYIAQNNIRGLKKWYVDRVFFKLRQWDVLNSNRVDLFVGISHIVADRIWRCYRRRAKVIYPFVNLDRFKPNAQLTVSDHFVVLSRLVSQKRVDIAVGACTKLGLKLKVIGDGPELKKLKLMAGPTIEFLGRLSDEEAAEVLQKAQALIFTPEEDFGIVPLEAQAVGRPVIAFGRGGALETVVRGRTGEFYAEQTVESLVQVLSAWDSSKYVPADAIEQARRFSRQKFDLEMRSLFNFETRPEGAGVTDLGEVSEGLSSSALFTQRQQADGSSSGDRPSDGIKTLHQ